MQYVFVMGNTYVVVLGLLKVAMLAEWAHILVPQAARTGSIFWWSCMAMIAVQVLACVGIVIALNLQCIPHAASWDFTITDAKCFPLYNLQLSSGIIYLATDIIMFFMPQHLIWSLQMSWKKKIGVSVVFGLGLLYVHCPPRVPISGPLVRVHDKENTDHNIAPGPVSPRPSV